MSLPRRVSRLKSIKNKPPEQPEKIPEALKEKGHDEHIVEQVREIENQIEVVDRLVKRSNRKIMSLTAFTFIPFHLYENRIDVEESRVTFVFKQPFSFQSHSVDIADISNVFIESAFFFAKMQIVSRTFTQNNITINRLNKDGAEKMRWIIEGLRTFANADIDTSIYEINELIHKLEDLHAPNKNP